MGKNNSGNSFDFGLLFIVVCLVIIGIFAVYSASSVWSEYKFADAFYYVKRQSLFAVIGFFMMYLVYKLPIQLINKSVYLILFSCLILLVIVLIPGVGIIRGGARSWIGVGAFSIQPSEFIKLGLIIFFAKYITDNKKYMHQFFKGFLLPIIMIVLVFLLIMLQPDFGTGVVILVTCTLMIFVAGARLKYFVLLIIAGIIGLSLLIISAPYRISRITAYLNPWADPLGDGFQIIQSLYAIGPGKLFGVGFGNSIQKYYYLPEPQTDFIFAIISEEFGFIGASFVILLFLLFCYRGIKIVLLSDNDFYKYIVFGITTMIIVQVGINISVVTGLIPVTGITLPLLSYGGSSLTVTLISLGVLLKISMYRKVYFHHI